MTPPPLWNTEVKSAQVVAIVKVCGCWAGKRYFLNFIIFQLKVEPISLPLGWVWLIYPYV